MMTHILNLIYVLVGGLLTIQFMRIGYKGLDRLTGFATDEELRKGNDAVGRMVQGMFIAIGVAIGLVIGLGLN